LLFRRFDDGKSLVTVTGGRAREFEPNAGFADFPFVVRAGNSMKVWDAAKSVSGLLPSLT
jgi:hypothetical protein